MGWKETETIALQISSKIIQDLFLNQSEDLRLILISEGSNLLVGKRVHLIQKSAGSSSPPKSVQVFFFNLVLLRLFSNKCDSDKKAVECIHLFEQNLFLNESFVCDDPVLDWGVS